MPNTSTHVALNIFICYLFKANIHHWPIFWCVIFGAVTPDISLLITAIVAGSNKDKAYDEWQNDLDPLIGTFHTIPFTLLFGSVLYAMFYYKYIKPSMQRFNKKQINESVNSSANIATTNVDDIELINETENNDNQIVAKTIDDFYTHKCCICWNDKKMILTCTLYWFLSWFIHNMFDFFLQHTDSFGQFYPFTNWHFMSLSYYECKYYGYVVG
eukprot:155782_1